jgi:hypothetical protein
LRPAIGKGQVALHVRVRPDGSTNTVKSELKSIDRKLEVSTRLEAIERGRQVGLLAPGSLEAFHPRR